ncbi:hypothetical protein GALMADRAFT_229660 [Galerina marginata CBS 339.88]|uniref:G-protein coupled receptors family 1 profile domain-containing protein n=1 Tax=Galerina marginata (strain CBS 339.88) TaxID=685588 RepID=A0A067SUE5_GALM3|nr:hypothetical protein GALMADRAFT_229660 [Galerina marginata CBS 339.88]
MSASLDLSSYQTLSPDIFFGTAISAVAYGIVLSLTAKCLWLLSKTKHPCLYAVNVLMLPFTIWGADGFMLWRCMVLYQNTSKVARIALFCVLGLISIASLGGGILFFSLTNLAGRPNSLAWLELGTGTTTIDLHITPFVNSILAGLIVGRLLYHQRYLWKVLGVGHASPYTKIMMMCVESAALIILNAITAVLANFFYSCMVTAQRANLVACFASTALLSLPHICVISPFIIVYRVAQGRVATILPNSEIVSRAQPFYYHFANSYPFRTRTSSDGPRGSVLIISNTEETSHI